MNIQTFLDGLDLAFASGKNDTVDAYLQSHLRVAEAEGDSHAIITILNEMAGYYRTISRFADSITAGERAIALMKLSPYADTVPYATTLLNTGTAYFAAGEYAKSLALYEQAARIYEAKLQHLDPLLAGLYNNMGSLYLSMGKTTEALSVLHKALEVISVTKKVSGESGTIYANLAQALLRLGQKDAASQVLQKALEIFELAAGEGRVDPHSAAALSTLGELYYSMKDYKQAALCYEASLKKIRSSYGENKDFVLACENYAAVLDAMGEKDTALTYQRLALQAKEKLYGKVSTNPPFYEGISSIHTQSAQLKQAKDARIQTQTDDTHIKGLDLARAYYEDFGKKMIQEKFPNYVQRIAVGLVGEGSECFGFDDAISTDHDFGPSFCLWLSESDYASIGKELQQAYLTLPQQYKGFSVCPAGSACIERRGVSSISSFYKRILGTEDGKLGLMDWLKIPESWLAVATNGEVFSDPLGEFTAVRNRLLAYYPEDVRLKKISARAFIMGQAGQYNYARCMRRGDYVGASIARNDFLKNTVSMVYLLNKKYTPFYKWMYKGLDNITVLQAVVPLLRRLSLTPFAEEAWGPFEKKQSSMINLKDPVVRIIEEICGLVKEELLSMGLSSCQDTFLVAHINSISSFIQDRTIRTLPLTEG